MTHQEAYKLAKRKARYGHKNWIVWDDREGKSHAEPMTSETVKAALLAGSIKNVNGHGIKHIWMVCANDGTGAKFCFRGWIGIWRTLRIHRTAWT